MALSKAGNLYARFCLGFHVHDATSGFRVYRREALEEIIATPITSDGYGFQIELVYRAWNLGLSVGEAPISFREREHGHSKISRRIVVEALWLVTRGACEHGSGPTRRPEHAPGNAGNGRYDKLAIAPTHTPQNQPPPPSQPQWPPGLPSSTSRARSAQEQRRSP